MISEMTSTIFKIKHVYVEHTLEGEPEYNYEFKKLFGNIYRRTREIHLKHKDNHVVHVYGNFNSVSSAAIITHDMRGWKLNEGTESSKHLPEKIKVVINDWIPAELWATDLHKSKRVLKIPCEKLDINTVLDYLSAQEILYLSIEL